MMLFWVIAGLMVVGALLFVVPPLLGRGKRAVSDTRPEANLSIYRDQLRELEADMAAGTLDEAQYQSARSELENRLLEDAGAAEAAVAPPPGGSRWPLVAVGVVVPLLSVSLYLALGKPEGVKPQQHRATGESRATVTGPSHAVTPEQIEATVESLAQKLKANPNDVEGWAMLARSYAALRRFDEAGKAYARAVELSPDDAALLADYAGALGMANGRRLLGEPEKIIRRALQADPGNPKALMLAGSAAFERGDYTGAIRHWQTLLEVVPPDSQAANSANAGIGQAQKLAARSASGAPPQIRGQAKAAGETVSGTVRLAPALKARVADSDPVFVFARAADGRQPLAIMRVTVKDLPLTFTLDDSMAMLPSYRLSSASRVVVGARISKSERPIPTPGDLQGFSQVVKIGEKGVSVTIDSEIK